MKLDSSIVGASFSGLIGLATAASSKVLGKKHDWIPLEKQQRDLAFNVTMGLAAAVILAIWVFLGGPKHRNSLVIVAIASLAVTVVIMVLLLNVLFKHRFVVTKKGATDIVVLGGSELTDEAQKAGQSEKALIESSPTHPELIWMERSLAKTKLLVLTLFIALFASASIGVATLGLALSSAQDQDGDHQELVMIQTGAVRRAASLKVFLADTGKSDDAYSSRQLRLKGCVIRVAIHSSENAATKRLTVSARLYSSTSNSPIAMTGSSPGVVGYSFVVPRSTALTRASFWIQLPRGASGTFYARVVVRRPHGATIDTKTTGAFAPSCRAA
jgi:hypothetical protein